jgi:hypothetical protein
MVWESGVDTRQDQRLGGAIGAGDQVRLAFEIDRDGAPILVQ